MVLSNCKERKDYIIKSVDLKGETLARAWELGFKRGEKVILAKKYRRGGGIVYICGAFVAVGEEVLSGVEVKG